MDIKHYLIEKIYTGETYIKQGRKHKSKVFYETKTEVEIIEKGAKTSFVKYLEGSKKGQITRKRNYKIT